VEFFVDVLFLEDFLKTFCRRVVDGCRRIKSLPKQKSRIKKKKEGREGKRGKKV